MAANRLTKAQRRKAEFEQEAYRILRSYQERQKHAAEFYRSGTAVGHLDIGLTEVFDKMVAAFEQHSRS